MILYARNKNASIQYASTLFPPYNFGVLKFIILVIGFKGKIVSFCSAKFPSMKFEWAGDAYMRL